MISKVITIATAAADIAVLISFLFCRDFKQNSIYSCNSEYGKTINNWCQHDVLSCEKLENNIEKLLTANAFRPKFRQTVLRCSKLLIGPSQTCKTSSVRNLWYVSLATLKQLKKLPQKSLATKMHSFTLVTVIFYEADPPQQTRIEKGLIFRPSTQYVCSKLHTNVQQLSLPQMTLFAHNTCQLRRIKHDRIVTIAVIANTLVITHVYAIISAIHLPTG